jgi:hypothetical protein
VRAKIAGIKADARAKGWPAELLYKGNFWDYPRRLAVQNVPSRRISFPFIQPICG